MIAFWLAKSDVVGDILIPKYYDPVLKRDLETLIAGTGCVSIGDLIDRGELEVSTGDEIGSESYGTGTIPFVRTSDISNWEIKSNPKQGVSDQVYGVYATSQDVQAGDILLVRDGTYLIGTNCFVTRFDSKMLFQSHILKFRLTPKSTLSSEEAFLAFNNPIVQRQLRARQFTADIIDTLGTRWRDVILPMPVGDRSIIVNRVRVSLDARVRGRCLIKQLGVILEQVLESGTLNAFEEFESLGDEALTAMLNQDTVSAEYGEFGVNWISSNHLRNNVLLPKYYDHGIDDELDKLATNCDLVSVQSLIDEGRVSLSTGDEPGKMAYGTGDIPFIRTSDFANWEIKHDPKQGVSEQIYAIYRDSQDVKPYDILLVRDGTYLVGTSTVVLPEDAKFVYCGGLYKIRASNGFDPFLLFGLLNSYVVKRQIRSKQFTRDVIDTLGLRLNEIILPIPKLAGVAGEIASRVRSTIESRVEARDSLLSLANLAFDN